MTLRSAQWYAGQDRNAYIHRAWMRRGLPDNAFSGRPQIAIANTASDLTPCNTHLDEVAASVKEGVWAAGGLVVLGIGTNWSCPVWPTSLRMAAVSLMPGTSTTIRSVPDVTTTGSDTGMGL